RSAPRSTQALTSSGARLARGPIENLAARLVDVSITDFRRAVGNKPSPARVTGPSRAVAFRPSNRRQIQLGSGAIVIEINDLYKYYDHRRAVGPVSVTIERGQVVGLLGLNGAGKTT